jgi:hypothetical protein
MQPIDPRLRQVLEDQGLLNQILNQAQMRGQQPLVPRQAGDVGEYRIFDEDSIRNDEIERHVSGAQEIDPNFNRNQVPKVTYGQFA